MDHNVSLFNNFNQCENCQRPLPKSYQEALCPNCLDRQLFAEVKEYIRNNDVNEYDVAEKFDIPRRQVKAWIREGRIEYKEQGAGTIIGMHCQRCGSRVNFGSLCPNCLKILNGSKGYDNSANTKKGAGKMRFVDKEE